MNAKTLLNRKLYLAFGAATLILLGLGASSYRDLIESSESNLWVRHTHEVLESLHDLSSAVDSGESSYRGYVLTGKESYVESWRANRLRARTDVATIGGLTTDNRFQQSRMPGLESLTAAKLQFGEMIIDLNRTHGFGAAADAIRTGTGQRTMDEFQTLVRSMADEELRLLEQRNRDSRLHLQRTKIVLLLGTLLGVLIAGAAGWTVRRDAAARDLAEEALREGEERFRTMANNISQLAWMADEKGSIFWYNQRWFDYTGTTLEEMFGSGWQKVQHPDHVQRVMEKISRCFQSGEVWEDTFPLRGRDGMYRWFLSRAVPAHDSKGKVLRWFGTHTDISEHLATEEHLAQMENRYRGLLEAAPDAMVVVNQAGEIVLLNVQAEKRFGYRRDELIGQKVKNIIPEGFAERLIADNTRTAAEALAQQIGTGLELIGLRKDGSEFPIEIMLSPLESSEGILVTAAIRDITERKRVDDDLRQNEERFRLIVSNVKDYANIMLDTEGLIVSWNQGAERIKGYRAEEIIGQHFSRFYVAEDIRNGLPALELKQASETGRFEGEGWRVRKDGSRFLANVVVTALRDDKGRLRGFGKITRDITERRQAEEALMKSMTELKRSNEELGQFAYVASHDLQEPLRMVASYTQLLAQRYKGQLDSDADEFIGYAVDGCNRMQRLIQDLLSYSRAGTNIGALCEISGEGALEEALSNLQVTIKESGAVVTHDSLPTIMTDDAQLALLFQNLIGNAIKYHGRESPRVHVSATSNAGHEWIFSVHDNGLGIEPQYFERIFILFQRLHGQKEFEGTGIGLAMCKKIVDRLGGRIWVESQPNLGSTFFFALPTGGGK
jgi:PAS domain S-box-containing protein